MTAAIARMGWNRPLLKSKLKALLAHLSISLLLVGFALILMFRFWFPGPLFTTDGGGVGLKLIVLVDLVLGPLLTFVVFHPAKTWRALSLDLGLIAVLQLGAYATGMWSIHSVRVQAIAYQDGRFHTVTADAYEDQPLAPGSWVALGEGAPYLVDVRTPSTQDELGGVAAHQVMTGLAPYQLQFLYRPYAQAATEHWARGWSLEALEAKQPAVASLARDWLRARSLAPEQLRFYPVQGYFNAAVLAVDAQGHWQGGFVATLPVLPSVGP